MNVLVACEESQRVCMAFRERGHNAFSCDIQEPSGGHPEWHILGDALKAIQGGQIVTMDGVTHDIPKWDLLIAHPPCTYLSFVANRSHSLRCTPLDKINERTMKRIEAMQLFMAFVNAPCEHIAIENPRGIMNTAYRAADQTIDPYMFADSEHDEENYVTKATCLWLKGLNPLQHKLDADDSKGIMPLIGDCIERPNNAEIWGVHPNGKAKCWEDTYTRSGKVRSKTFDKIAQAMAEQWG
jgi:hypothetical protein